MEGGNSPAGDRPDAPRLTGRLTEAERECLRQYAAQARAAASTALERYALLALVKETIREQLPHPEREDETKALADDVVTWCIEAYYHSTPAA